MNPQETQQAVARDEKWVPSAERVKISSTNIILETTVPQKEETFQVIIDVIKNSTCFKAFTISVDVLEIFMQQFWYTIKKVQDIDSYEFLLANKKCSVNAKVFRTILNIYPRVEGVDFTDVSDDDTALTFLIDLGYKGLLNRHTNMFVDHMHQPWRTLEAIINKCLSGKTASNDKLKKSRIDILWGMFNRENFHYPELIWEDFAYQIDHRKEKRSRRKNMSYPRFTKIIINHFLKQHKSLTNLNHKHFHTIKDYGIVSRLKFVRIGEDYQEYGLPIPNVMLTDAIKRSESYHMFIKYSTKQIPPKKSRGKGSKGKKTAKESQETIDVSEESEPEPQPAKKNTSGKRRVKNKVTLSANDNIISDDPDLTLELAKSISQTESEKAKAVRKVHTTHARIVTEFVPESAKKNFGGRSSKSVVIQDTCTLEESRRHSSYETCNRVSNEGTKMVLYQGFRIILQSISATSSEGTGAKPRVLDEEKDIIEEKVILEWGDKQDSEFFDDDNDDVKKDNKDDDADDEGDDHIRVRKDKDAEMKDAKVEESDKGEEKVTDEAKEESKRTSEAKDDTKKTKLPPSSSSLSVSSGFGDQFLKLSSDSSLVSTVKDSADTNVSSLLDIPIQHETPQNHFNYCPLTSCDTYHLIRTTPTPIPTPPIITDAPTIITTAHESDALSVVELRVAKLEKDMSKLKILDHTSEALVVLQSQVPTVVDSVSLKNIESTMKFVH
ncbi:hypothetical protein Tco_0586530 [Tanacetum coccineum]